MDRIIDVTSVFIYQDSSTISFIVHVAFAISISFSVVLSNSTSHLLIIFNFWKNSFPQCWAIPWHIHPDVLGIPPMYGINKSLSKYYFTILDVMYSVGLKWSKLMWCQPFTEGWCGQHSLSLISISSTLSQNLLTSAIVSNTYLLIHAQHWGKGERIFMTNMFEMFAEFDVLFSCCWLVGG